MSVKKEPSGRRSVQVEIEVPGTPEEVWEAIATGPGVSAWFVPVDVEKDENGNPVKVISHLGPGMDAVARPTAWEPPHRFAAESQDLGPNAPTLATEWIVEARSGGTCVVRVVHSLFASTDDWDDQLSSFESGWPGFFRVLWLYLTYFRGQPSAAFRLVGCAQEPESKAWGALTSALGLAGAAVGERRISPEGAPPLGGLVEGVGEGKHPSLVLLRLDAPAPGVASLGAHSMCGPVFISASFYFYGDGAAAAVESAEPVWQAWMQQHFPFPGATATPA